MEPESLLPFPKEPCSEPLESVYAIKPYSLKIRFNIIT